jgi:hypothetical protein
MPGVNMVGVEGIIDAAAAPAGVGRQAALLQPGVGKRPWSFIPGWKDHLDFGEQFPYDPETAKALLKTPPVPGGMGSRVARCAPAWHEASLCNDMVGQVVRGRLGTR